VVVAPGHARSFDGAATLRKFLHQLSFDTASVLRSLPFLILLGLGLANLLSGAGLSSSRFGTSFYPVTGQLLRSIHGSYQFLLYLIVAYYAGEVVWRERDARVAEPTDASPVPNWLPLFAKMGALFAVVLVFLAAGVLACIGYQLWHGYTNLELVCICAASCSRHCHWDSSRSCSVPAGDEQSEVRRLRAVHSDLRIAARDAERCVWSTTSTSMAARPS
jgi:hypothetical protein